MALNESHAIPPSIGGRVKLVQNAIQAATQANIKFEDSYICHAFNLLNSKGFFLGDDPLNFSVPLILIQLSLMSIFTGFFLFLLKPLGQPYIISQILGGLTLGPSILGRNSEFAKRVFPPKGKCVLDTFAFFGLMIFVFLVGVKIDPTIISRSGKRTLAMGVLGFIIPYTLAQTVAFIVGQYFPLDHDISEMLPLVVAIASMTAFPVITCFLAELQILNSEIGRLASSSSLVCDVFHWLVMAMQFASRLAHTESIGVCFEFFFATALLISFIMFVVRPAALWAIQHTPEGEPVKEIYIFWVLVTFLISGFMGQVLGIHAYLVSFVLGLAIPDGPPLGAALVDKIDCFVSVVFQPIIFIVSGLRTDVFAIKELRNVGVIHLIVFVAFCGKIVAVLLPLLLCRMPFRDALSLGFVMNCKGIIELAFLIDWKLESTLSEEFYAIMIVSVVLVTGIVSPAVKVLYDPSRRFLAYKRRTILHHSNYEPLRILACIHKPDNVLAILNLLAASNPTMKSPIDLAVLHLVKLAGRASSLLVAHVPRENLSQHPTESDKIFNAFMKFEHERGGLVTLRCYKGISPYETMHNDVCYMALEKRVTFIVIPFQKKWIYGGKPVSSFPFKHLTKNVLEKAPCSVGVLVDRGNQPNFWCDHFVREPLYQVAVFFFGGADDREALALARRMLDQPNVYITLVYFSSSTEIAAGTERSKMLDTQTLSDFRLSAFRNQRISYKEARVMDGRDVLSTVEDIDNVYDLVMVGRRHGDSNLMSELKKWKDGELGTVGEILASLDIGAKTSVLVVQQQTRLWGLRDPEESTRLRRERIETSGV
ncbi:cation/H(+) antiporter 15-like isoform X2 [Prosopis cineraria]|uniref:cation/H(+) antiporter 15-like isoform X2 n=1 Tax=Prosopis cineraria TaxID=364024 RepID=UPI00240EF0A3|nr:cation/H(+) antiporter 15-like isoform X2 [Prosopis cineraria]